VNGSITGVRFYKHSGNTGTHRGYLWTNTGTLLASATFTNETASGWQTVTFGTPVSITANTVYVAAYHSATGGFSSTANYFNNAYTNGPLTALAAATQPNGRYIYGAPGLFPNATFQNANYWVAPIFTCPNNGTGLCQAPTLTPMPSPTRTPTPTPTPIPIPINCGVIPSNLSAINLRRVPSANGSIPVIGQIGTDVPWRQFTPVEQFTNANNELWYLITYNSYGSQPYQYNGMVYDGTRAWVISSSVNIAGCTSGGAIIPLGSGAEVNLNLKRNGQPLPIATGANGSAPDPADIWSPLGQCPPGNAQGWTPEDIRRRCAYENYIRLWHEPSIAPLTLGEIASISVLYELNLVFPDIRIRTINGFADLYTSEKHLVEAIARNLANTCIVNGSVAGNSITCNSRGIIEWAATLSPWKNRSDQPIQNMLAIGPQGSQTSYTHYDSKIMPIVFGNSTWASGASGTRPSTWGNYQHIRSGGQAVPDLVIPMIETEFSRNPPNTVQIDFMNSTANNRELAVYVGQPALINQQVYHAREVPGTNNCLYSFVTTVISPNGLGTLGTC
jgi:Domain of unknown function (DUF4082)